VPAPGSDPGGVVREGGPGQEERASRRCRSRGLLQEQGERDRCSRKCSQCFSDTFPTATSSGTPVTNAISGN
jgi:hypothetical protein